MFAILRGIQLRAHRPSQLACIYSGHLLIRPSSSAANHAMDECLADVSRKVSLSQRAERDRAYRKAYYQKNREALLLRQNEPERREARKAYYRQYLAQDPAKKEAQRLARKEWHRNNKEAANAKKKVWRSENAAHVKEYHQQYYQRNQEAMYAHSRKYRLKNPEVTRQYHRQYRLQNAEAIAARRRARYLESPERILEAAAREERRTSRAAEKDERQRMRAAEKAERQAERDRNRIENKAARERRLEEQRKNADVRRRLEEERASIDKERVTRLAEKELFSKNRSYLLRQLARQKRLESSSSSRGL